MKVNDRVSHITPGNARRNGTIVELHGPEGIYGVSVLWEGESIAYKNDRTQLMVIDQRS